MRMVAAHFAAGYVSPQGRPSCRDCKHSQLADEGGIGITPYTSCRKHGFEVRAGGVCPDHPRALAGATVASPVRGAHA